ncbi:MAG TPA: response regulator [Chthoniobacteraceae bacterium]|jgi:signal transduction histidine kinase|nr:response regulator [Chthoniobacteraceae bacterium]
MMTHPVKFLLVDDLEANLLALEGLLRRDGLELLKARSGREALEILLTNDVALALLDVQLPEMDGFELAALMRGTERTRRVPIIFLTAGAMDQGRRFRGYEAGAVDFIFKPIEPHILRSKVDVFFELAKQRDALKVVAEEAQAANRAKDYFLAALSHELRTPLTPVLMTASELEDDATLAPEIRQRLAMIRRNVELEARLIDDLLDITRVIRGKLTIAPVAEDIHQFLLAAAEIVRSDNAGKGVEIHFALDAERHHAAVDPIRIQQVFWNLIRNALKFTPAGGSVTLRTGNDGKGSIIVTVEDNGVGISAESLPQIFDAFNQGDVAGQHRYGGLGLGLAISRAIIEAHSGEISAASEGKDKGAVFTVKLASVDAESPPCGDHAKESLVPKKLRLLVVEDHEATRSVLARLLARDGHDVTLTATVHDAIAEFAAHRFDAVISDLGLPDGSGLDLMRTMQRQRKVAAIALSGFGMEEDILKAKDAGFSAHLIKPVNINDVRRLIAELGASMNTPAAAE